MQVTDEMVEEAWVEFQNAFHEHADTDEGYRAITRRALTAALAKAWEPIESAPRDRAVLVAAYIVPSAEAQRNGSQPAWHIDVGRAFGTNLDRWTNVLGEKPSHWMPLPSPPPQQQEGE